MFARVTTAHGAPEKLDAGLAAVREGLRASVADLEGFRGGYVLIDRHGGKHMSVTLWDTREAAETRSELPPHVRRELMEAFGLAQAPTHEIFEVAVEA
ncbi:MAG TPA: hypothetical protein VF041_03245 [Gemmatimonadaceae bacterium]